jgi:uncharacterized protein YjiK
MHSKIQKILWLLCCLTPSVTAVFGQTYDYNKPSQTFKLPYELNEISGLSLAPNAGELIAVIDELATIFFISKKDGKITKRISFADTGDFEGVEFIEGDCFAVKSNGKIYRIKHIGTPKQHVERLETDLKKVDNIEGLGYDPTSRQLFFAAKGQRDGEFSKKIYFFRLESLSRQGLILRGGVHLDIKLSDIQNFINNKVKYNKIRSDYEGSPSRFEFGPSGVAVQPKTGNIFVLSSINKMLIIFNRKGEIIEIEKLDKSIHRQPEGICFDEDGTLYISNEIKDSAAPLLHVFKPKK